jgi:cytochrome c-type biogenesis protein CcmH
MVLVLVLFASQLQAVEPGEVLSDPILEERARDLSQGLRCPVCQNESIDESNAPVARDLRLLLRERLVAGDSDEEAVSYLVSRFGEFILLEPTKTGANLVLWLAAPAGLLFAFGIGWTVIRRKAPNVENSLSDDEKAELAKILKTDVR